MPKRVLPIFFLLFCTLPSIAQKKMELFKIPIPKERITNSLYNSIRLLDIRKDTADFGIVQKGAFNRRAKVIAKPEMAVQLSNLVNVVADSSMQSGELLLLLRQCSFAEIMGTTNEKGYFNFRAILFSHEGTWYKKVASIDTVMMVKAMDVTKKMFRHGSKIITDFITKHLSDHPTEDLSLAEDQLTDIDNVEKSILPLYTANTLANGIYYNFHSFVNQQPDES